MAALLRLPSELRLQIYEILLSRQPYHIYVDEYFAKDCQDEWIQLKTLLRFDPSLTSDLSRVYWRANTFMVPEVHISSTADWETATWVNDHVKDNLKDLRFLEFGFSERCRSPRPGGSNAVCYNVVLIDVQRERARLSKSGRRGDGCDHVGTVLERLESVMATNSTIEGRKQLTEDVFWALYSSCHD